MQREIKTGKCEKKMLILVRNRTKIRKAGPWHTFNSSKVLNTEGWNESGLRRDDVQDKLFGAGAWFRSSGGAENGHVGQRDVYDVYCISGRGRCPLHDIRKNTGISKQTLNSALRKPEKDGIIYLEQSGGKTKTVCFTVKGRDYAANTAGRLFNAECNMFMHWTQEETGSYMHLTDKYNSDLKRQTKALR